MTLNMRGLHCTQVHRQVSEVKYFTLNPVWDFVAYNLYVCTCQACHDDLLDADVSAQQCSKDFDFTKYSGIHVQLWDKDTISKGMSDRRYRASVADTLATADVLSVASDDFLGECTFAIEQFKTQNGLNQEFSATLRSRSGKNDRVQGSVTVRSVCRPYSSQLTAMCCDAFDTSRVATPTVLLGPALDTGTQSW
jgi:hypothetical protein